MNGWVLATRSEADLARLRDELAPHGVAVVAFPVLTEVDFDDPAGWNRWANRDGDVQLLAFTSRRAPSALRRAAGQAEREALFDGLPSAAVGPATETAAREVGFAIDIVGDAGARRLATMIAAHLPAGATVVHPCAIECRTEFADTLARNGIETLPVAVYATSPTPVEALPPLPDTLPLAVLITSPRAAAAFFAATDGRFAAAPHIAIGDTTAAAVSAAGQAVRVVSSPKTEVIVEELCLLS